MNLFLTSFFSIQVTC